MDNQKAYLDQCIPERVVVLGQLLNPFSLGHLKILLSQGNTFVCGGLPSMADLVFAVWICCQTYEEAITGMYDMATERKMLKWGRRMKKADLGQASKLLAEYIQRSQGMPAYGGNEYSRPSGCPTIQQVQIVLMGKLNHTLSEALNKPWGEALWDYVAYAEQAGSVNVMNEADNALFEKARAEMGRAN